MSFLYIFQKNIKNKKSLDHLYSQIFRKQDLDQLVTVLLCG